MTVAIERIIAPDRGSDWGRAGYCQDDMTDTVDAFLLEAHEMYGVSCQGKTAPALGANDLKKAEGREKSPGHRLFNVSSPTAVPIDDLNRWTKVWALCKLLHCNARHYFHHRKIQRPARQTARAAMILS
jgi:hypothetical protein